MTELVIAFELSLMEKNEDNFAEGYVSSALASMALRQVDRWV
jgi:hypothetical protein